MKEGDIILVHNKKINSLPLLFGWIIRVLTRSHYNHTATIIHLYGELRVYEAIGCGCYITHKLKDYVKDTSRDLLFIDMDTNIDEYRKRVKETIGKKYDYLSAFWFFLLRLTTNRWFGHTGEHAAKKFVCSELSLYLHNQKWWNKTPKDIYDYYLHRTYRYHN